MKGSKSYKFCGTEPGIFVEMYLPKKPMFQGPLFEALNEAITNPSNLIDYFKAKKNFIKQFLAEEYPKLSKLLDNNDFINRLPSNILKGYSMYEVDGMFLSSSKHELYNERTQVIRIMFKYDKINDLDQNSKSLVKNYLRNTRNINDITDDDNEKNILYEVEEWINYTALIIFGYLVFNICEEINKLKSDYYKEDEIWITSFWNLCINKVKVS